MLLPESHRRDDRLGLPYGTYNVLWYRLPARKSILSLSSPPTLPTQPPRGSSSQQPSLCCCNRYRTNRLHPNRLLGVGSPCGTLQRAVSRCTCAKEFMLHPIVSAFGLLRALTTVLDPSHRLGSHGKGMLLQSATLMREGGNNQGGGGGEGLRNAAAAGRHHQANCNCSSQSVIHWAGDRPTIVS